MSLMVLILPIAFLVCWLFIETFLSPSNWRLSFLLSFLAFNAYLVLLTELLSLFYWLTAWGIFLGWVGLLIILGLIWLFPGKRRKIKFPNIKLKRLKFWEWTIISMMIIILILVGIVAFLSRPSVADVLNYHLPRVAHWLQNRSVNHYASGIEIQNRYPPGAEYQVLHLFALTGSDLLVKFSAWAMLLMSMVSCSLFAAKLGINRSGQLLSALFVATLPVALTQASSVKNDIHVAAWTLLLAALMLVFVKDKASWPVMAAIAVTFSLGYLTKSTTMLFMLPLIVWFGFRSIKKYTPRKVILWIFMAVIIFLLINGGFFWRNIKTYGVLQDVSSSSRLINEEITLAGTFSNLLRNAAFNLQYPWDEVRDWMELFIIKVHAKLGMDVNEPKYTSDGYFAVKSPNTDTVFTGNTLHAHLLLISMVVAIILLIRKKLDPIMWMPIIMGLTGFLILSAVIKWQVFGARYSLSVFFLMAPLFGLLVSRLPWTWAKTACALALMVLAYPWLLSVNDRPLISIPQFTSSPNLFEVSRFDYTPRNASLAELPNLVEAYGCDQIGIYGKGGAVEYEIWSALDAPRENLRIDWLVAGTPSAAYNDESFTPCLIVCVQCSSDLSEIRGLVPIYSDPIYVIYGPDE